MASPELLIIAYMDFSEHYANVENTETLESGTSITPKAKRWQKWRKESQNTNYFFQISVDICGHPALLLSLGSWKIVSCMNYSSLFCPEKEATSNTKNINQFRILLILKEGYKPSHSKQYSQGDGMTMLRTGTLARLPLSLHKY